MPTKIILNSLLRKSSFSLRVGGAGEGGGVGLSNRAARTEWGVVVAVEEVDGSGVPWMLLFRLGGTVVRMGVLAGRVPLSVGRGELLMGSSSFLLEVEA